MYVFTRINGRMAVLLRKGNVPVDVILLVVLTNFMLLSFFDVYQIPIQKPMPSTPGSEVSWGP